MNFAGISMKNKLNYFSKDFKQATNGTIRTLRSTGIPGKRI
jgi:hypothetical protein